ncbi:MAG TPA: M14 family zinc carboxypeptidase [Actinomycetota bacterium]
MPAPQPRRYSRRDFLKLSGAGAGSILGSGFLGGTAMAGGLRLLAPEALQLARVYPRNARDAQALASFDDTHAVFPDGSAEFLLWPGDRTKLDKLGLEYRITVANLRDDLSTGRRATGLEPQPGERTAYRVLNDYVLDLQTLATQHPDKARVFEYPLLSLEGRKVYGIEIAANVHAVDGRPTVCMDGVHHAREWPAAELPHMFGYDLLQSYGTDERVTAIMDNARVVLTSVMNPDGFDHSRGAPTDTDPGSYLAYWRKNERSYTDLFYSTANVDAHGTDPNRNYPFFWGGEGGNTDPQNQTYAGSAPYAEPESRNIANMMKSRQVTSYLTHHTYGKLVMRPWGNTSDPSPDNDFQRDLGAQITAINKYTNQIGLQLYPTSGTSRDWSYDALRTIVYTFEHGTAFHPAYLSTVPAQYALNRIPFLLVMEAGVNPENHGVIVGKVVDAAGAPVAATIRAKKSFDTLTAAEARIPETIDTTAPARPDGTFELHVNPSTRPRTIMAGGGPEAWDLTIEAPGGTHATQLVIDRGDRVDLETITI